MDANGLRFRLLADAAHWRLAGEPPALEYDTVRRALRLARQRRDLQLVEDATEAEARLARVPQVCDSDGNRAWYDEEWHRLLAAGGDHTPRPLYRVPREGEVTDLALADDGVLYLAVAGSIVMHDLRGRWDDAEVSAEGFHAWRLAAAPGGGVWALDRANRRLARLQGYPLSHRAGRGPGAGASRPCTENPDPPRLRWQRAAVWPEEETPVALACSLGGTLACVSWRTLGGRPAEAVLRRWSDAAKAALWRAGITLRGTRHPYSLAWVAEDRVAVLVCGESVDTPPQPRSEARVYAVDRSDDGPTARFPSGDLYPLKPDYAFGPFLHGLDYPPHYPALAGSHALHRLSFPFYTAGGEAMAPADALDAGEPGAVWHRLYLEASIPPGCGLRLWLAASETPTDPATDADLAWYEHRVGERHAEAVDGIPVASWVPLASELPHHPGLLPCAREAGRKGLFTLLIQRSGRRVRSLRGRYLYLRLAMEGPGNATPELFAVRAYAERFSYVEHYLPELYHEQIFAPEADEPGGATPADFLERFVDNLEGVMTTLEDRIAYSDLLTRPQTAPAESLDWLGGWIGLQCEPGWTETQRRRFLEHAAELHRWHGTLRGLRLALEIASDGGVSRGEIVPVEDFRLRRTFATILGANLDDRDDPLTLGGMESGNSFVGDSLFVGDPQRREFLALFAADLDLEAAEAAALDAFFDRLAFRLTVLVHDTVTAQDLDMIRRIAEREVPAHVALRIHTASAPLLAGISALVGVDTYLAEHPPIRPARVDQSRIGRGDLLLGPATLDPRRAGMAESAPPVAHARDVRVGFGEDVTLDGSDSRAAEGRRLVAYRWSFEDNHDLDAPLGDEPPSDPTDTGDTPT